MSEDRKERGRSDHLALEIPEPEVGQVEPDADLEARARGFVDEILAGAGSDASVRRRVDAMGIEVQRQAAYRSEMLQAPIRDLAAQGEEGGPVAASLDRLRQQMGRLDPSRNAPQGSWLDRLLARLPGIASPMQRYFRRFETAQQVLEAIIRDLEEGAERLQRDNLTLADDQLAFRGLCSELEEQVQLGRLMDRRLVETIEDGALDEARRRFAEEELLFPLRQRITDLQQQLAVTQQGVLALEVLIRNNRELIRGVDRAIHVTTAALNVAVTVALALANQRLVLDRVARVNRTTSDLIAGTAGALRQQGAEIQNRASSASLDMEQLEAAFADVLAAIDDVSRYRQEALPVLDQQISRLADLSQQGHEAIHRLDESDGQPSKPAPDAGRP